MKIIFAGTPEFAAVALAALIETDHDIVAVYTQPDRPSGRGRKLKPGPVKQLALENNLPVHQPQSLKSPDEQQILKNLDADIMVVVAYGLLLPKAVLEAPRLGCINIHGSILPRWRGAAPIHRAILAGDKETGITIMQMDEGLDTGDMLLKVTCPIISSDTTAILHDKLAVMGGEAMVNVLGQFDTNTVAPVKQDDNLAVYAHKLSKSEAEIDWLNSAKEIDQQIRAFNPWPVAQCKLDDQVLRIWQSEVIDENSNADSGKIIKADKAGIDVATGAGVVRLHKVQLPGGKPMDVADFVNSHHVAGKRLQ